MDGVHAHLQDQRKQDGRQDDNSGQGLHEGAYPKQEQVNEQQYGDFVFRKAEDGGRNALGHLLKRHDIPEYRGHRHQHDDNSRSPGGLQTAGPQRAPCELPVNEQAHEKAVKRSNSRCLGRRHDAAVYASQYDDGDKQGTLGDPNRLPQGLQVTLTRCAPPAVLFGDAIGHEHKHKSRQDPRSDARQEKFTHGSLPRNAIDHERITGRDHDADGARARHDRSCEHLVVTAFRHRRDGQRADGRHGGGPRTADCGEEHARGDTGESDPAG